MILFDWLGGIWFDHVFDQPRRYHVAFVSGVEYVTPTAFAETLHGFRYDILEGVDRRRWIAVEAAAILRCGYHDLFTPFTVSAQCVDLQPRGNAAP